MKRLEREALLADRAAATEILATIPADDELGRLSFESRVSELNQQLEELEKFPVETAGSVALMFAGEPVHGSRSIDASFSSAIVGAFQNLVTSQVAAEDFGVLGARGPLPVQIPTNLAITDVLRGSVGFLLEEATPNVELTDSRVKYAIAEVTSIIVRTVSEDEATFESAVESVDPRLLKSLQKFYSILETSHAIVRIVAPDSETLLTTHSITKARERLELVDIDEKDDELVIELVGVLPESKRFEMRIPGSTEIITGTIGPVIVPPHLELNSQWRTRMRLREVRERNKVPRTVYTLLGLLQKIDK